MCTLICIITMATILCKLTSLSSWDCFSSHQSIVKRNMIWWRVCVKTEKKLKKRILKKKNCAHFSPYFFFLREKQKQPNEKLNKTKFVSMFSEWYTYFLHVVILAYVTWGVTKLIARLLISRMKPYSRSFHWKGNSKMDIFLIHW